MSHYLKRTWAQINLDALEHNYNVIKKHIGNSKLMCVIKGDAYGHGAVTVAGEYERLGADYFAVSNLEEALQLRNNGITLPILILGYTPEEEVATLSKNNITQTVFSLDYAQCLSACAVNQNVNIKIHLKLDTGMTRIGLLCQDDEQINLSVNEAETICKLQGLDAEGIFTHFCVSDEGKAGRDITTKQLAFFKKAVEALKEKGITFKLKHCANSGAIIDYPETHLDMVRAGIILYGLKSPNTVNNLDLQPVMHLKSVISHIKNVCENTYVSYGRTFITNKPMKLATIPIGYADGYNRNLSNKGFLLVNNKKCNIVGRVCMDQIVIDVTDVADVKRGDLVTVFGDKDVTCDTVAKLSDTINYEVVCLVGKRVPRVYYKNGKMIDAINGLI